GAHGLRGRDAEIREATQMVEDVLPRIVLRAARQIPHVADVRVAVDECRNHRLAAQVNARGASRGLDLSLASDAGKAVVFYEERAVLDGLPAVANDQTGAFEERHAGRRRGRPRRLRVQVRGGKQTGQDQQAETGCAGRWLQIRSGHAAYGAIVPARAAQET